MNDKEAVISLAALAHMHRLRIFRILVERGPSGMAAGEIAENVDISPTSTSFHLKELERAGLISSTRDGRYIRYAIHIDSMRSLLTFLTEDCCQGKPEICGAAMEKSSAFCDTSE